MVSPIYMCLEEMRVDHAPQRSPPPGMALAIYIVIYMSVGRCVWIMLPNGVAHQVCKLFRRFVFIVAAVWVCDVLSDAISAGSSCACVCRGESSRRLERYGLGYMYTNLCVFRQTCVRVCEAARRGDVHVVETAGG